MFSLGGLICILSLIRVISVLRWDLTDITYTNTRIVIYSILEPTLGLVNACLPTIKPALHAIFGTGTQTRTRISKDRSSMNNSSLAALLDHQVSPTINDPYNDNFVRLEDSIPLAHIHTERFTNANAEDINTITVTRRWDVDSSDRGKRDSSPNTWRV
ncbi:hypothetical protein DL770_006643 [Monosporascus sp. CRB-9-2]|nr:hypothetical protein DL770_006643 [Monosporascus sp. CRB-9-2]